MRPVLSVGILGPLGPPSAGIRKGGESARDPASGRTARTSRPRDAEYHVSTFERLASN